MITENGAMYHVPTVRERFSKWVGYRYHLGKEPEGIEAMPGWMVTESRMHFSLADRLRLLVSGRLHFRLTQYTSAQVEGTKNRLDWHILAPGDR